MGLQPGNGDSYFQEVPLVEITGTSQGNTSIKGGKQNLNFDYKKDIVTWSLRVQDEVALKNSELVFCGFGIVAPEYGWNDYEGIDMKGKTAVIFVNDPGFYSEDSTFFKVLMIICHVAKWKVGLLLMLRKKYFPIQKPLMQVDCYNKLVKKDLNQSLLV